MGMGHPESPDRIATIVDSLKQSSFADKLYFVEAEPVSKEQLSLAHSEAYIEEIYSRSPKNGLVWLDPDTAMNPYTLRAAELAAGSAVQAVDLVMANKFKHIFCAIRPPGHHAIHNQAMGFCFFNNLAVGVKHAISRYGLERIAIIDFDVHHGNGTEDIFQNEGRVTLYSSFQHPFYPYSGTHDNDFEKHTNMHPLPLPAGADGNHYRKRVQEEWIESLHELAPQLIFVSAGFDAHTRDPLGGLNLTNDDYLWLGQEIKSLADQYCAGRLVSCLEGGYDLNALADAASAWINPWIA